MTDPTHDPTLPRCGWATSDPLYIAYHDEEWGRPVHDDRRLFEMLILEGAQAGLSWITILRRRETYRQAFEGFDPARIARYGAKDVERLMADPGIIRNRAKTAGRPVRLAPTATPFRTRLPWLFRAESPGLFSPGQRPGFATATHPMRPEGPR